MTNINPVTTFETRADRDAQIRTAFREGATARQISYLTRLSIRRVQEIVQDIRTELVENTPT